ncbi:hypothetical protein ABOM_011132 [Aspergillus bombycis]|uniref:Zn(2)-C6 fungal-type domain-containing protein n=1 Tax=Aspergillus bombycis TaxID=109264 RepID=A0A1F7ZMT6_9EURO|nr:hypothetical protein ABOM_011132 [Aspergillus bombycis]OGM40776.1 hypothetical protein ABOM_011132 [Aspergillus bombycis]
MSQRSPRFVVNRKASRRKRSSKACLLCHDRKIRCDAAGGRPCTNCRWFKHECIIPKNKYEKREREGDTSSRKSTPQWSRKEDKAQDSNASADDHQADLVDVLTWEELNWSGPIVSPESRGHNQMGLDVEVQNVTLPQYISPLLLRLSSADRDCLRVKGALNIPEAELLDALLECFALFVHPFLPVIDLGDLYSRIESNGRTGTVSLVLLQMMMFAATAYVDISMLNKYGYHSAKEAQLEFFNRAQLLYSLDCEPDRLAVLQSVILMTLRPDNPDLIMQTRHHLTVAMTRAQLIHQDPTMEIPQRLWKRILWTCYMRDCILAISFRTPMITRYEEFDIPPLELQDFDARSWLRGVHWISRCTGTPRGDVFSVHALPKLCIALAECCRRISYGLDCQYGAQPNEDGFELEPVMQSLVDIPGSKCAVVSQCVEELERWYNALPRGLQWSKPPVLRETSGRFSNTIILHRAILHGVWLAAKSALCHAGLACEETIPTLKFDLEHSISDVSSRIRSMFYQLNANGLTRYLPDAAIALLKSAMTAETSYETGTSAGGSVSQHAFCLPRDATIPAWSTPISGRNHEWDHAVAHGATTSFLSSVNLMPEERALLLQLSSASGYMDSLVPTAYF